MLSRWNPQGGNPLVGFHPYPVGSALGGNPPEKGGNPTVSFPLLPGGFPPLDTCWIIIGLAALK